MPDLHIPFGTRIEAKTRGVLVNKPELGGAGAMALEGHPGWIRRIDEVETVTVLVNDLCALRMPEIDDRILAALPMLAEGATTKEIAQHFHLGVRTVTELLAKATRAWGARDRTHLVSLAYQHGVLPVGGGHG